MSGFAELEMSISETPIATSNSHNLGQIVRAELKQQLAPFSGSFGRVGEMMERTARSVDYQAHDQDIFNSSTFMRTQTVVASRNPTNIQEPDIPFEFPKENPKAQGSSAVLPESRERSWSESRTVSLFSTDFEIRALIGTFNIRVTSYRIRNDVTHQGGEYFRWVITFVPKPQLCSHGLSIAYSSGPDNTGYCDIFPRIQTFSIIMESSPLWDILVADDLPGFIRMLHDRNLSLRDRSFHGSNILTIALQSTRYAFPDIFLEAES